MDPILAAHGFIRHATRVRKRVTSFDAYPFNLPVIRTLNYPDATILSVGEEGLASIRYEETEHFSVTRRFLNDPADMLARLFPEP